MTLSGMKHDCCSFRTLKNRNPALAGFLIYGPGHYCEAVADRHSSLPGDRFTISEKTATGAVLGQACRPDNTGSALFDTALGILTAHVGPHPTGTDGIDLDGRVLEFIGKNTGYRVQRRLREPVTRAAAIHI